MTQLYEDLKEAMVAWIASFYQPEDVFTIERLESWAQRQHWIPPWNKKGLFGIQGAPKEEGNPPQVEELVERIMEEGNSVHVRAVSVETWGVYVKEYRAVVTMKFGQGPKKFFVHGDTLVEALESLLRVVHELKETD